MDRTYGNIWMAISDTIRYIPIFPTLQIIKFGHQSRHQVNKDYRPVRFVSLHRNLTLVIDQLPTLRPYRYRRFVYVKINERFLTFNFKRILFF